MSKIRTGIIFSPPGIFAIYILASALAIMGFRFIFPGEPVPLAYFSIPWRLIRGLLDFLSLFPALALSALVIPFGFKIRSLESTNPFSPHFLQSLKSSIITAIVAAAIVSLLFSLVFPIARDYEVNLRFQSRLYKIARELAEENAVKGEWSEVSQFLGVCERIWPKSPEISKLRIEADIWTERERLAPGHLSDTKTEAVTRPGLPGPQPVNSTEALAMAETALSEERYFDAHWLATLGGRLAAPGSAETALATRLAGMAWQGVNSMAPNASENQAYRIYRLKREGYDALLGEEWIRSYFIFRELLELSPKDPDAAKYLALSENGVKQVAFFIDEMELTLGRILTGAIFSLPSSGSGRLVMRVSSLSTFSDFAEGIGTEILAFDRDGQPLWSIEAPYVKIMPLVLDSGPAVVVLLRALDRVDKTKIWEPVVRGLGQRAPGGAQIVLEIPWDVFLLLTKIDRGLFGLSYTDLRKAAGSLAACGYQPQVFEVELLRRFIEPLFFLPLGIFAIVIGWRYRALKRPRYIAIPMLGILPLVFYGVIHFCRGWVNNLGIWAVISLGFTTTALFFAIGVFALLALSLIILAAQRG